MAKSKGKNFVGPKSICICGHTGDGENSQHNELYTGCPVSDCYRQGKGHCKKCDCECFTWKSFTKKYQNFLDSQKR
jgi:hypothetical protein